MKTVLLVGFVALTILVGYWLVVGPLAPLWVLLPALVFALLAATMLVTRQWLPVVVLGFLRISLTILAVAAAGTATAGLWSAATQIWVTAPIVIVALLAILYALATPVRPMPRSARA